MALSIKNSRADKLARQVAPKVEKSYGGDPFMLWRKRLERLKGRRTITDVAEEIMRNIPPLQGAAEIDPRSATRSWAMRRGGCHNNGH